MRLELGPCCMGDRIHSAHLACESMSEVLTFYHRWQVLVAETAWANVSHPISGGVSVRGWLRQQGIELVQEL